MNKVTPASTLLRRMQEQEAERTKGFLQEAKVRLDPATGVLRGLRPAVDRGQSIQREPLTIRKSGGNYE